MTEYLASEAHQKGQQWSDAMICWYCYWGWPKQVRDIYDRYAAIVGTSALQFGPGHIVWSDDNFERENIEWCIAQCDDPMFADWDADTIQTVRQSLRELLALPDEVLYCVPDDYDDENPERYPPSADLEMIRC